MRYNDSRNDTNVINEVLPKYKAAWGGGSMFASNGLIVDWYRVNQKNMAQPMSLGFTAWFDHPSLIRNQYQSNLGAQGQRIYE